MVGGSVDLNPGALIGGIMQKEAMDREARRQESMANAIKLVRPTLRRTQGNIEQESLARKYAMNPNDELMSLGQLMIDKNQANTNAQIQRAAGSGIDAISGALSSNQQAIDASMNNMASAYQRQFQSRQDLYRVLSDKSQEEYDQFKINQYEPYQQDYLRKMNLTDAAARNRMTGSAALAEGIGNTMKVGASVGFSSPLGQDNSSGLKSPKFKDSMKGLQSYDDNFA